MSGQSGGSREASFDGKMTSGDGKMPLGDEAPMAGRPGHFADRMIDRARALGSRLIVGLDPDIDRFPQALRARLQADPTESTLEEILVAFLTAVIDATASRAVAYKPQAGFFEQYGLVGMAALQRILASLRARDRLIILDAKRNDIRHTAAAYGRAWLGDRRPVTGAPNPWRADALTINAYFGSDGVRPFLEVAPRAGLFVLARTSNPSSQELQALPLRDGSQTVAERLAALVAEWGEADWGRMERHSMGSGEVDAGAQEGATGPLGVGGFSRIGLVVGATWPEEARRLRRIAPRALFLMPGIGAQGGGFDAIAAGSNPAGEGAFAAVSRSLLYGFDPGDGARSDGWAEAIAIAAAAEIDRIDKGIGRVLGLGPATETATETATAATETARG